MRVRQLYAGWSLIDFLGEFHPPTSRQNWLDWIARGEITLDGQVVDAEHRVSAGERYLHVMPGYVEPSVNAVVGILFEDDALLVVDKPAPLPVHPSGRFNRNTLSKLLAQIYPDETLRIAHRLDANTTGVVVFCRTAAAAAGVQSQFENRQVAKLYLARVQGHVPWHEYRCDLEIGDAKQFGKQGTAGARLTHASGQVAETLFRCRHRFHDGTSLLEVVPITGRTNQIRVHAAAIGFPIVGDAFYAKTCAETTQQTGRLTQTLGIDQPPMCLHAWRIGFEHPGTPSPMGVGTQSGNGKPVPLTFESPPPAWVENIYER